MSNPSESSTFERPEFKVEEAESSVEKIKRKSKDNPLMALGLAGCFTIAAIGIYRYKHRGNMSISNYLMQLRVTAQGVVIGALTLGVVKSLYDHLKKKDSDST